jgi:hypothetical protein
MRIEKNMNEQQRQIVENSTKLLSFIVSSSSSSSLSPDRTRTVINVIYILGIVFMIIVFLVLLWINLCSRRCWCWHDTPLIHRFNRHWLVRRSMARDIDLSPSHNPPQRSSNEDELNS